jgi:predicted Zn-dependent peptidase
LHQKTVLDNGLRFVFSPMPHTRSVSICFFIGIGSRYEADAQAGISHFIEHLCFKGTAKRPSAGELSAAIEGVGGILNAGTDKEFTVYWSKVARPHFSLALDVLVDMLFNSKFEPKELERERQVIIEEIHQSKDSPAQEVNLLIDELLWPGHPLGRDIAGSTESMTAITRDMVIDYLESCYLPENTVIAIAGSVDQPEAINVVNQALANWSRHHPRPSYLTYDEQPNPRLHIEHRDTEQVHLCLGLPGLPLLHPKRFILDLLNAVLGEGMSSRLFTEIRDRLGLAYSIHSYIDHFLDTGSVTIYAGVEPRNLHVALKAIVEQLLLLKEPVREAELSKAKELVKGRLLLRMEDSRTVAGWMGAQEILTGDIFTVDQVASIIDAITANELEQLARELLVSKQLRLAVVGPIVKEEPLEELLDSV